MAEIKDLIIQDFHTEISQSPYTGFADMRGLFTDIQGRISLNPVLKSDISAPLSAVAVRSGSEISITGITSATGDFRAVTFTTTGTLPTGLTTSTVYWLRYDVGTDCKIYDTYFHAAGNTTTGRIDLTDTGSGVHTCVSVNPGRFKYIVEDASQTNFFAIDTNCKVWTRAKSSTSGSWYYIGGNTQTGAGDTGLAVWKNYLFVIRDAAIDTLGPLSSAASSWAWTDITSTFFSGAGALNADSGTPRHSITLQNDILYFAQGRRIGSLAENSGQVFAPGTGATATGNGSALTLPTSIKINKLLAVGDRLAICTNNGLYSWDTTSSFDFPTLYGQDVKNGISYGNTVVLFVGDINTIYVSNLTSSQLLMKLPEQMFGACTIYPGAVMIRRDRIYFGVSDSGTLNLDGVWSFDPNNKAIKFEHFVSNNAVTSVRVGALFNISDSDFLCGWSTSNESTTRMDSLGSNTYSTSYLSYLVSPIYTVGFAINNRTFPQLEITMDRPLASGDGVKVYYRTSQAASFTLAFTFDNATYGTVQSFNTNFGLSCQQVQFRVEITSAGSTTTPYLKDIRFR